MSVPNTLIEWLSIPFYDKNQIYKKGELVRHGTPSRLYISNVFENIDHFPSITSSYWKWTTYTELYYNKNNTESPSSMLSSLLPSVEILSSLNTPSSSLSLSSSITPILTPVIPMSDKLSTTVRAMLSFFPDLESCGMWNNMINYSVGNIVYLTSPNRYYIAALENINIIPNTASSDSWLSLPLDSFNIPDLTFKGIWNVNQQYTFGQLVLNITTSKLYISKSITNKSYNPDINPKYWYYIPLQSIPSSDGYIDISNNYWKFIFKSSYSSSIEYNLGNVVTTSEGTWVCLNNNLLNKSPIFDNSSTASWLYVSDYYGVSATDPSWNPMQTYMTQTLVIYNGIIYRALQQSRGRIPGTEETVFFWKKIFSIDEWARLPQNGGGNGGGGGGGIIITGTTGTNGGGGEGIPGPRGPQGLPGSKGFDGNTGPHGPQGITGPKGPQGDVGLQGPRGPTGFIGINGFQGATGITGPQGATGITGPQGSNGVTGPQGATGTNGPQGATGITGPQGATGITGPRGATGINGSQGATGIKGPQGATGIKGPQGATGIKGPQGATGIDGFQGATGVDGPQGATGVDGPQGATGVDGPQGVTGVDGPQGVTGINGPQGATGVNGPQGATGVNGFQGATGIDGPQGATGIDGHQGATGIDGPQGATGIDGPQGATGIDGPQGATGIDGPQGATGIDGFQGVTGINGPKGATGMDGPQGANGVDGPQGATGINGPPGATGINGPQGVTGINGPQGVTGINGPQGATGIDGPQGATGINGPQGATGIDGPKGSTGNDGPQGSTGVDGPQGSTGIDGPQGATGIDGFQGANGVDGPQGATGINGPQGATGINGPQGATGIDGPQGATGIDGPQGATGISGPQGATGIDGPQGFTGVNGPQGSTGINGPQGSTGINGPQGSTGINGPQGSTGINGPQGTTGFNGPQGTTGINGPEGSTGIDGPQGANGIDGPQGATGIDGPQGSTGVNGPQGSTGVNGPQGSTGVNGPQGSTGINGPQGSTGINGPQGSTGINGPQGSTGINGPQGSTGINGFQGSTGINGPQGNTGINGSQGSTGINGSQGSTGINGPQGATGIDGPKGSTGINGPQGSTGIDGPQGATGVNGSQGSTGILGPQGFTGVNGPQGSTGVNGPQGSTGINGPQGSTGINGPQGSTGINGPQGFIGINGPQGSTGIDGPQGATGVNGSQGSTGINGPQGSTGINGPQGSTGIKGPQGSTGVNGSQGSTGVNGPQGSTGVSGPQGSTGIDGFQGPTGINGHQGSTGINGPRGSTGINGFQGSTGVNGPQGATGINGPQGSTGINGPQGSTGINGPQGSTGINGPQGSTGINGPQGSTGINGPQGTTGVNGPQGSTGIKGPQGSTGVNGFQGSTGINGPQGSTGINGPEGPTGIDGPQGSTGVNGPQGSTGTNGLKGSTGINGPQGSSGINGPRGATGINGPQGSTGIIGPQGSTGVNGFQGSTGINGPQGSTGINGPQGSTGINGPQGSTGINGPQGATGIDGPQGSTGINGPQGFTGVNGPPGSTGISGPQGSTGIDGSQGSMGIDGFQGSTGIDGPQGSTGITGHQGATGVNGPQGIGTMKTDSSTINMLDFSPTKIRGTIPFGITFSSVPKVMTSIPNHLVSISKATTTSFSYRIERPQRSLIQSNVAIFSSCTLSNGSLAIAYQNPATKFLEYIYSTDSNCTEWNEPIQIDITVTISDTSLQLVNNKPTIVYTGTQLNDNIKGILKYIISSDSIGSSWSNLITVIGPSDNNKFKYPSLHQISTFPAISYYDIKNTSINFVISTDSNGNIWQTPTVIATNIVDPYYTKLTSTSQGPVIFYYDNRNRTLATEISTNALGSIWQPSQTSTSTAILNGNGIHTYLTNDATTTNSMIYHDKTSNKLFYLLENVGLWNGTPMEIYNGLVDELSANMISNNPSVAINAGNQIQLIRANDSTGSITWGLPVALDTSDPLINKKLSLVTVNENPAVAYYGGSNSKIKYIRASDSIGSAWNASLSLDVIGQVHSLTHVNVTSTTKIPMMIYTDQSYMNTNKLTCTYASNTDGSIWYPQRPSLGAIIAADGTLVPVPNVQIFQPYQGIISGRHAIAHTEKDVVHTIRFVIAQDIFSPVVSEDTSRIVMSFAANFNVFCVSSPLMIGGVPSIVFAKQNTSTQLSSMILVQALDPLGQQWGSEQLIVSFSSLFFREVHCNVLNDGSPIVTTVVSTGQILVFTSDWNSGTSTWNWTRNVNDIVKVTKINTLLGHRIIDGIPMVVWQESADGYVYFRKALSSIKSDVAGDWVATPPSIYRLQQGIPLDIIKLSTGIGVLVWVITGQLILVQSSDYFVTCNLVTISPNVAAVRNGALIITSTRLYAFCWRNANFPVMSSTTDLSGTTGWVNGPTFLDWGSVARSTNNSISALQLPNNKISIVYPILDTSTTHRLKCTILDEPTQSLSISSALKRHIIDSTAVVDKDHVSTGLSSLIGSVYPAPRVAYYDSANKCLKFAKCTINTSQGSTLKIQDTAIWTTEVIDSTSSLDVGMYASLCKLSTSSATEDIFAIAYYDNINKKVKFARQISGGSGWIIKEVKFMNVSKINLFLMRGRPVISVNDIDSGKIYLIQSIDSNGDNWPWNFTYIFDSSLDLGKYISLQKTSTKIAVAAYDNTNKKLRYFYSNNTGLSWNSPSGILIDNSINNNDNQVGRWPSLNISSDDIPSVVYIDDTIHRIKLSKSKNVNGTSWNESTLIKFPSQASSQLQYHQPDDNIKHIIHSDNNYLSNISSIPLNMTYIAAV